MSAPPKPVVLIVDDTVMNIQLAADLLAGRYQILAATDGPKALALLERRPDVELILLDVVMPGMDGYQVCARLKAAPATARIPVIFLTSLNAAEDEHRAFTAGAVDFVTKPLQPATFLARVDTHVRLHAQERNLEALVRERTESLELRTDELEAKTLALEGRTAELEITRLQMIHQLGRAAEFKDDDTGLHVIRLAHYVRLLADAAGLEPEQTDLLFKASPLHDVGKLGIPDHILQKAGPLTAEEARVMQTHPEIGQRIIGAHASPLLDCARVIALTHHERWDGSGYPHRLRGTDIPLEGRICAIADVFDALTSVRPYKPAWPIDQALEVLAQGAGRLFDPELVTLFVERLPEILAIREQYSPKDPVPALAPGSASAPAYVPAPITWA